MKENKRKKKSKMGQAKIKLKIIREKTKIAKTILN